MNRNELFNNKRGRSTEVSRYIFSVIVVIIIIVLFNVFYTIDVAERGVLLTFGKPDPEPKAPGLHIKFPFVQNIVKMNIQTQKYQADLSAASKDLQVVKATIAINYHLLPGASVEMYSNIGKDFVDKIIYPIEQETNKATTSQYTAEELISMREAVTQKMSISMTEKLLKYNIVVEGVNIIDFDFSESFNQAIEEKVTAEQLKLKADRDLERIKIEAEQKVTQAQAEATSIQIQSEALRSNQDVLKLRFIEKWDGVLPKVMSSNDNIIDVSGFVK